MPYTLDQLRCQGAISLTPGTPHSASRRERRPPGPAAKAPGRPPARPAPGGDRLHPRSSSPTEPRSGPSPVDRTRPGSKHHVPVDGQGIPPAVTLTGDNRNDVTRLLPPLAKIPPVAGLVGRPRHRPDTLLIDGGYDHDKYRRLQRKQGIKPVIARRGVPHGSGPGVHRWVVKRTMCATRRSVCIPGSARRTTIAPTSTWAPRPSQQPSSGSAHDRPGRSPATPRPSRHDLRVGCWPVRGRRSGAPGGWAPIHPRLTAVAVSTFWTCTLSALR